MIPYRIVVLDTGPLSLLAMRPGHPHGDAARAWARTLIQAGLRIIAPEIADYETRRELLRLGNTASIARLDVVTQATPDRYLPITTDAMRKAAELWADARNRGIPTAAPQALDGDVILAAQALTMGEPEPEIIIATTNATHLSRYLAADLWSNITP